MEGFVIKLLVSAGFGFFKADVGHGVEILIIGANFCHREAFVFSVRIKLVCRVAGCGSEDASIFLS